MVENILLIILFMKKMKFKILIYISNQYKLNMLLLTLLLLATPENYHPDSCSVEKYVFSFVKIGNEYKVHGLWPDECRQCETCGYPTCCNMKRFQNTTFPKDKQFLDEHWLSASVPHPIHTCGTTASTLIEHEVIKHASCMNLHVDEYIEIVKKLFYKYHDYVSQKCHKVCSLKLDEKYVIIE